MRPSSAFIHRYMRRSVALMLLLATHICGLQIAARTGPRAAICMSTRLEKQAKRQSFAAYCTAQFSLSKAVTSRSLEALTEAIPAFEAIKTAKPEDGELLQSAQELVSVLEQEAAEAKAEAEAEAKAAAEAEAAAKAEAEAAAMAEQEAAAAAEAEAKAAETATAVEAVEASAEEPAASEPAAAPEEAAPAEEQDPQPEAAADEAPAAEPAEPAAAA